jgi:signal transduction histidine kinase
MAASSPTHERPALARTFRTDWVLLGLITLVCLSLSLLQWRWTGEFARAESVRLRAVLADQTQRMAQAFDDDLRSNCMALLPRSAELRQGGAERAHLERYVEWRDQAVGGELFRRVAIAVPGNTGLQLFRIDGGRWRSEAWPPEWAYLQEEMTRRWKDNGRPPFVASSGDLLEMPLFAEPASEDPQEIEWMIFEISRNYVQQQLLPGLMAKFLNPTGEVIFDAALIDGNGNPIFGRKPSITDARADLFPIKITGTALGRRRGPGVAERVAKRWTLLTWHRAAGSVDEAVAQARRRNLSTSLALITLLAGAAWALVHYTATARRLAYTQMDFVAGVSHDLRTPLAAIRGAAYNICGGLVKEPESLDRYGRIILRNAENLTGMIENLLAFAVLKKARARPVAKSETVDLDVLIRRAAASIEHELETFGGELEVEVAPETPQIAGDALALERAMRNLLDNAVRHGAAGKWIGVTARPNEEGMVEIRVRDRGPGIAVDDIPRIFEPFYSGEASRRNQVHGTGLGLSLVKETVEAHGGTIKAGNMASGGAEFIVRLPAVPREAA